MPQSRVDKAVEDFIDSMLQLNSETFKILFTGVGGIPLFVLYFKKKISQYVA